jgi:hypothetical protein
MGKLIATPETDLDSVIRKLWGTDSATSTCSPVYNTPARKIRDDNARVVDGVNNA